MEELLTGLQQATGHAEALKKLKASHLESMPWKARQVGGKSALAAPLHLSPRSP